MYEGRRFLSSNLAISTHFYINVNIHQCSWSKTFQLTSCYLQLTSCYLQLTFCYLQLTSCYLQLTSCYLYYGMVIAKFFVGNWPCCVYTKSVKYLTLQGEFQPYDVVCIAAEWRVMRLSASDWRVSNFCLLLYRRIINILNLKTTLGTQP